MLSRVSPVCAAFEQGCRRSRPGSSTAAPSSAPNRNIVQRNPASPATSPCAASSRSSPRPPEQVEMRRAGFSATTRQGIKNTSSPAGNVGERARRRRLSPHLPLMLLGRLRTPYLGPPPNRCQAQRRAADRSIPALKRRFNPDSAKQKSTMSVDFGTSRRADQAARTCFGLIAFGLIARRCAQTCGETAKLLYIAQT